MWLVTFDIIIRDISEMGHLNLLVCDFSFDIIIGSCCPKRLGCPVRYGVKSDFELVVIEFVYQLIVGVLMTDVESGTGGATVRICAVVNESAVCFDVKYVHPIVKCKHHKLQRFWHKCIFITLFEVTRTMN